MKTNLTFALLIAGILNSPMAHASDKTQMALNCYETENKQAVFSVKLPKDLKTQTSGDVKAQLGNGQKLSGVFESHVNTGMTRISGMTSVEIEANYPLPDYSKPHTLQVSIIGQNSPKPSYFGTAQLLGLTGNAIAEYFVDCKLGQ